MSITDELREWTRTHTVNCSDKRIALVGIAHRIDMAYQKAEDEWNTRAERTCRMDCVGYIGTEESHASIYQCSKCNRRYMSANVPDLGEYCSECGAKVVEE